MSKQAQKVRVSQLAKDLGVDWKLIKAKCESEGIDQAKTASSTVSLGLSETIREWFGSGGTVTAVETAPKVEAPVVPAEASKKGIRRSAKKGAEPGDEPEPEPASPASEPVAAASVAAVPVAVANEAVKVLPSANDAADVPRLIATPAARPDAV